MNYYYYYSLHRYLKELRQHYNVFPTESLILIFSNIEKIYRFQRKFLERLRIGIEHNKVADTFLEFVSMSGEARSRKLTAVNIKINVECFFLVFLSPF